MSYWSQYINYSIKKTTDEHIVFFKVYCYVTFERASKKKFEKLIKNAKNIIRVGYFQSGEANNFKILLVIKY